MAQEPGKERSLDEIKQRIADSRNQLGRDLGGLRYELDIPLKIRKSFQRKTVVWFAAALVLGVMLSVVPARRKKVYVTSKRGKKGEEKMVEAGILLTGAKLLAGVLKPVVVNYLMHKVNTFGARPKPKW